jgi:uncharacterized protein (DUF362 family)
MEIVSIIKPEKNLENSIKNSLESVKWKDKIKRGDIVFIKVNICIDRPVKAANVNPEVIGSFVSILKNRAGRVIVGESDASSTWADIGFKISGIDKAVEKNGGEWINISKDETEIVRDEKLLALNGKKFSKTILNSDVICSCSPMKTHEITDITCTIKNLFGTLPYKKKILFHPILDKVLSDLVYIYKPKLTLVDGLTPMEGNGPAQGDVVKGLSLIIAGENCVSTDATAAKIMGFNPLEIGHIRLCYKRKLGEIEKIKYVKLKPVDVLRPFKRPERDIVLRSELFFLRNPITRTLFFQTPLFELFKIMANKYRDRTRRKKGLAFE